MSAGSPRRRLRRLDRALDFWAAVGLGALAAQLWVPWPVPLAVLLLASAALAFCLFRREDARQACALTDRGADWPELEGRRR